MMLSDVKVASLEHLSVSDPFLPETQFQLLQCTSTTPLFGIQRTLLLTDLYLVLDSFRMWGSVLFSNCIGL